MFWTVLFLLVLYLYQRFHFVRLFTDIAEIRMVHHLSWTHPFEWIPAQTLWNEAESVWWAIRDYCRKWYFRIFRDANASFGGLLKSLRPCGIRRTQNRHDFADLIHFRVPKEERLVHVHFSDDASNGEDVYSCRVDGKFEEKFRCSVPSGGDVLSVGRFASDFAGNAEIDDFDGEIIINEYVFGFEVAVEEALLVDVEHSFRQLPCDDSYLLLLEFGALLLAIGHEFVEILFDVLKYEVSLVDDPDHLFEFDYVWVVHLAQRLDFRKLQTLLPRAILLLQTLDGDDLLGLSVFGLLHVTEWPWAQLFQNLVFLHPLFKSI